MNEAIFSVSRELSPVRLLSMSTLPSAFRSVLTVMSLFSTCSSCLSVFRNVVRVSFVTWSSWSSMAEVWVTMVFWLVTVPDSVPAVMASELRPELSWGSAPEFNVLRASPMLFSEFCVLVLKSVASLDTLSDVDCVFSLNVLRSLSVPAAVLLVSSSFLMMSWYCALSLTFLSFSMSRALLSVTLCMLLTACCAVPLADETAVVTLLMLVVVSLAACEIRPEPFSKAVLALEVKVLRPFCAVPMAVAVFARPLPALAAASCTSFIA